MSRSAFSKVFSAAMWGMDLRTGGCKWARVGGAGIWTQTREVERKGGRCCRLCLRLGQQGQGEAGAEDGSFPLGANGALA